MNAQVYESSGSGSAGSSSTASFDVAHRRAKVLEARLEQRVQVYASLVSKIDSDAAYSPSNKDVEGGMSSGHEEASLSREVDMDLVEMVDCIDTMRACPTTGIGQNQNEIIKRFHEVHFDYSTEYKKATAAIHGKRNHSQLLQGSNSGASLSGTGVGGSGGGGATDNGADSAVNRLLRERSGISSSMRGVHSVLAQAAEAKDALLGQRASVGGTNFNLNSLTRNIPSLGKLVDSLSKKKGRENAIVAAFCGLLLFFTLWWLFLR